MKAFRCRLRYPVVNDVHFLLCKCPFHMSIHDSITVARHLLFGMEELVLQVHLEKSWVSLRIRDAGVFSHSCWLPFLPSVFHSGSTFHDVMRIINVRPRRLILPK